MNSSKPFRTVSNYFLGNSLEPFRTVSNYSLAAPNMIYDIKNIFYLFLTYFILSCDVFFTFTLTLNIKLKI
jgi:hypothetical protein